MKKIDYFELYDKKDLEPKIVDSKNFVLNLVDEISTVKKKDNIKLQITPYEKLRIKEIKAIKSELLLLRTTGSSKKVQISKIDEYRKKELIHCSRILQEEGTFNF